MIHSQTSCVIPIAEDREFWIDIVGPKEEPSVLIRDCVNACSWGRDMRPQGDGLAIPANILPELIKTLGAAKDGLAEPN
jgi:hypothetical protein